MENHSLLILLLLCTTFHAQEKSFSPFSLEASYGISSPIKPFASNYQVNSINPLNFSIGGRYMYNNYVGIRLSAGYSQFRNGRNLSSFTTNYFRTNIEGIVSLDRLFLNYVKNKKFSLFLHTGVGYSIMREKNWDYSNDEMLSVTLGLTPNIKLTQRLSLLIDCSIIGNIYQSRTFDFSEANIKRGVDGYLFNASIGVNYAFGKKTPADWYVRENLDLKENLLKKEVDSLYKAQLDDNKDGVANFLDQEVSTENAFVNSNGVTVEKPVLDEDGDGVPSELDECPFEKGTILSKGCPDYDNDSIPDRIDFCPYIAGVASEKGCPEVPVSLTNAVNDAMILLKFTSKTSSLNLEAKQSLKIVGEELLKNGELKLIVRVHVAVTDDKITGLKISHERATAIEEYLISLGINTDRIVTLGLGMSEPIAPIEDPKTNALNDRVDLKINY
jgi:OmpA-OmpF porin, OOP family